MEANAVALFNGPTSVPGLSASSSSVSRDRATLAPTPFSIAAWVHASRANLHLTEAVQHMLLQTQSPPSPRHRRYHSPTWGRYSSLSTLPLRAVLNRAVFRVPRATNTDIHKVPASDPPSDFTFHVPRRSNTKRDVNLALEHLSSEAPRSGRGRGDGLVRSHGSAADLGNDSTPCSTPGEGSSSAPQIAPWMRTIGHPV